MFDKVFTSFLVGLVVVAIVQGAYLIYLINTTNFVAIIRN